MWWPANYSLENNWAIESVSVEDGLYKWDVHCKKAVVANLSGWMPSLSDLQIDMQYLVVAGSSSYHCGIEFRNSKLGNYNFGVRIKDSSYLLQKWVREEEKSITLEEGKLATIANNPIQKLRILAIGDRIQIDLNDVPIVNVVDNSLSKGKILLRCPIADGEFISIGYRNIDVTIL